MNMSKESFEKIDDKIKENQIKEEANKEALEIFHFEDAVTPEHLKMITQASGGFTFVADQKLAQETLETGVLKTGYTNKETKIIYYNPLLLKGSPELGIKPWRKIDIRGFAYHEAGHHAKEVLEFDNKLTEDLKNPDIIPEAYKGSPDSEVRFLQALYSHLDNALIDMWLESFMGRRPYFPAREDIKEFQSAKGEAKDYRGLSKCEQLVQVLLRSRYLKQENLKQRMDEDAYEAYERILKSGAMKALLDRSAFENYFSSPAEREKAIKRKFAVYKEIFLPEYLKLLENELEERKKERQQQKQKGNKKGKQISASEAAPLTKEEEEEIKKEILEELEKAGQQFKPQTLSPDEKEKIEKFFSEIKKQLGQQGKPTKSGPRKGEPKEKKEGPLGEEAIRKISEELQKKEKEIAQRGLAESMGVKQESVRQWNRIKEERKQEIESLAGNLSEIFIDNRRRRLDYLRREGEIVPGLEYETISALLSGELDPDTKMKMVRDPEFLETELEFIVDTSGSMMGKPIENSVELLVIVVEAFKKIKEDLDAENLLADGEEPFRVGVTKFTTLPERVTKLTEPLNDKKELIIIDKVSEVGGGTDETGALKEVYKELALNKKNVIKIMTVLTDGAGNKEGVAPIMRQIEEDNEVIFLAIGLGSDHETAQRIVDTYLEPLKEREGNIFGQAVTNPDEILPAVVEFLKREIAKRKI